MAAGKRAEGSRALAWTACSPHAHITTATVHTIAHYCMGVQPLRTPSTDPSCFEPVLLFVDIVYPLHAVAVLREGHSPLLALLGVLVRPQSPQTGLTGNSQAAPCK